MQTELEKLISLYRELEIDKQIDYDKFYLYSLITHSTAIEGSTITELENQIMFDQGISLKGKSITEQNMNLDLKNAYETAIKLAHANTDITIDLNAAFPAFSGVNALVVTGMYSSKGHILQAYSANIDNMVDEETCIRIYKLKGVE